MAVPSNPTVSSIVQDALRHVLTAAPTSGQETELTNNGFQTVKTEIWAACANDDLLRTSTYIILPIGNGQVDTPTDFNSEVALDVYAGPESWAFTAVAGASGTITLPSTFSADVSSLRGRYLFTTGGTGSGQYRQITAYDDTTKVASITPNWTVNPDATTTAFIGYHRRQLVRSDRGFAQNQGLPQWYRLVGSTSLNSDTPAIELMPVPDHARYALVLTYAPNLTRLDESGSLFVKHLRERRFLWIQGLVAQATRRYDEARYPAEEGKWQAALAKYSTHNHLYSRVEGAR